MQALGFVETKGLVAAIEAADSALKASSVSLVGKKTVGGGLVTVIVTGDVAAVNAAVDAGKASASAVGEVVSTEVIARPHEDLSQLIYDTPKKAGVEKKVEAPKATPAAKKAPKRKSPGV